MITYVAFFSDVEHEVAVVKSGYRVTLTYNLYFTDEDTLSALDSTDIPEFEGALFAALKSPDFLPNGGLLGFGLAFMYPVSPGTTLSHLLRLLKGSDATIKRVCDCLSLSTSLKAVYKDEDSELAVMVG